MTSPSQALGGVLGNDIGRQIERTANELKKNPAALQQAQTEGKAGNAAFLHAVAQHRALEKVQREKQIAAMQMQQQPGTVVEQEQDALLTGEKELMGSALQGIQSLRGKTKSVAGVVAQKQKEQQKNMRRLAQGQQPRPQGQPQRLAQGQQPRPQGQLQGQPQPRIMAKHGGLMTQAAPNLERMYGGGIVAFANGGGVTEEDIDIFLKEHPMYSHLSRDALRETITQINKNKEKFSQQSERFEYGMKTPLIQQIEERAQGVPIAAPVVEEVGAPVEETVVGAPVVEEAPVEEAPVGALPAYGEVDINELNRDQDALMLDKVADAQGVGNQEYEVDLNELNNELNRGIDAGQKGPPEINRNRTPSGDLVSAYEGDAAINEMVSGGQKAADAAVEGLERDARTALNVESFNERYEELIGEREALHESQLGTKKEQAWKALAAGMRRAGSGRTNAEALRLMGEGIASTEEAQQALARELKGKTRTQRQELITNSLQAAKDIWGAESDQFKDFATQIYSMTQGLGNVATIAQREDAEQERIDVIYKQMKQGGSQFEQTFMQKNKELAQKHEYNKALVGIQEAQLKLNQGNIDKYISALTAYESAIFKYVSELNSMENNDPARNRNIEDGNNLIDSRKKLIIELARQRNVELPPELMGIGTTGIPGATEYSGENAAADNVLAGT